LLHHRRQANERGNAESQLFADTTFDKSWSARVGDERISAHYFGAAHTNGDIVVHFEAANVAHLGDLIFNRRFPYIDRPGGANISSWIQVLAQVRQRYERDTLFIFGHAAEGYAVTGKHADIQAYEAYLSALLDTVGKAIKAGNTKEQILALSSIPGAPEWTGEGIQRSLTAAWEELQP
jgi:glyoxylase-like metal-dependent hydrolase (beta-lactamase superfamily II)